MRTLLLILMLLPALAHADDRAAAAAAHAQAVQETACAGAASGRIQTTPASLRRAVEAWDRVNVAYDTTGVDYLLYWRGVLGLCVGQEELAIADLQAFVEGQGEESTLVGLLVDATRRLERLGVRSRRASSVEPALALGIVAGSAGLGLGLGSLPVFVAVDARAADVLQRDDWTRQELDPLLAQGDRDFGGAIGLAVGGAALGVVSALLLASRAPRPTAAPVRSTLQVVPSVAPASGGLQIGVGGRW